LDVRVHLFVLEAAGPKVNYLDLRVERVAEQDILGLQVTVDDFVLLQQVQRAEQLLGEASDEFQGEAAERVRLDEFVEVHIQKLGRDAQMAAEVETVGKVDHAVLVLGVLTDG